MEAPFRRCLQARPWDPEFAVMTSALFCIAGVTFAHVWRKRFKRGPLEAIMRALTEPRERAA